MGVIANAADAWPPAARKWAVQSEIRSLSQLGYRATEIDLRLFERAEPGARATRLAEALMSHDLLWVRGGNTFVLRSQLARSGADTEIRRAVIDGNLAYGGYSAGACIASPALDGLELCDDVDEVAMVGDGKLMWDGLGLVPFRIVPHFRSPGHENPERIEQLAARYAQEDVPFRALSDDDAIVVDGHW
ncbi:Type 1 glutamine amidotransferase-like domain-containing protein [Hoyosella rhizosphaerae]|uniref:Type 1 glutamine amidotransferase-like domain-containing protein n=1 Tax=Hoyosella rhizosphaerae TaxID=1755582 RepID=UPI0027DC6C02|nr:Type 1 glutamine amidotransferase-like domain-containing protein [Hoyosella rhizosphaerae]